VAYIREITAAIRNDEPDKPGNWQSCKYMKKKSIENGDNIFWPGPKKKKKEKKVVGGAGEVIEQVES
jgi:hypothetical protein